MLAINYISLITHHLISKKHNSKMEGYPSGGGYLLQKQDQHNQYLKKLHKEFLNTWNKTPEKNANLYDFNLRTVLGTGAFGIVFLAQHRGTGKHYAMKILEKEKIVKLHQIEHTYFELKILIGLNFPFVVYMKYFFKDNVYIYFVMPYIAGGELFTHLRKLGRFDETTAKFYAAQVLLALEYLHACKLVYRDLKPENILIDETGYIKITDFGFCKHLQGRTWSLCGTPEYLAPEIILSKGYGMTVDWWSFGILIYEMCAGHPPFYAKDPMRIYEKIVIGKYRRPSHFSEELIDLILHVLQVDVTKRYGNLKNGILDFKNHEWFRIIDWDLLLKGKVEPPFVPIVRSHGDVSNFDKYDDQPLKTNSSCLFENEFAEF